jgi:hypothetical protein
MCSCDVWRIAVLSLPSKPWKKVRISELGERNFQITFVTELENEAQFREIIEEDIAVSLGPQDSLGAADWVSRSVIITTADLTVLKRNLVYASIMVEAT